MEIIKVLHGKEVSEITDKILKRQEKFDEDLMMSVGIVIMNYGDSEVRVQCTGKEWRGTKGQLQEQKDDSIPLCPNGHPLFETSVAPRLGLIQLDVT